MGGPVAIGDPHLHAAAPHVDASAWLVHADARADDAHPGAVQAHARTDDAAPRADDAHPGADDAHPGAVDVHPRALDADQHTGDGLPDTVGSDFRDVRMLVGSLAESPLAVGSGLPFDHDCTAVHGPRAQPCEAELVSRAREVIDAHTHAGPGEDGCTRWAQGARRPTALLRVLAPLAGEG